MRCHIVLNFILKSRGQFIRHVKRVDLRGAFNLLLSHQLLAPHLKFLEPQLKVESDKTHYRGL